MKRYTVTSSAMFLFVNREVMRLISAYGLCWTVA